MPQPRNAGHRVHTLLLVRNGVSHDARVLRAARVAERALDGKALVVGVATASAPAGEGTVEGLAVVRLPARLPVGARLGRGRVAKADDDTPPPDTIPARTPPPDPLPTGRPPIDTTPTLRGPITTGRRRSMPEPRISLRIRIRRVLAGASFTWQALAVARRVRPQLVQANDWNTMWCAVAIKLVCGARVVYDSHELWADRNGRWEWRPWLLLCEALFTRVADAVVTASPGYAEVLARRYRMPRPTVIRNIPEGGHATGSAPQAPPLVVYVGGLMAGRGLEQAIDALALTRAIRLRMVGPGAHGYRTSLLERADAGGVGDRVELLPPVGPAEVGAILNGATAGLCLIQPVCRSYELTLPNKLFEYAAAGLPVLASDLPVLGAVVRENELGEVVAPADPRKIAAGLERLVEPERRREAEHRTRTFASANGWSMEARMLAAVYRRAVSRTRPARAQTREVAL